MASPRESKRRKLTEDVIRNVDDVRIDFLSPLLPPACLMEELPLTEEIATHVQRSRAEVQNIISGTDDRLFAVVGPCSIHDTEACLEYAKKLAVLAEKVKDDVKVVMRVYFEKPRTTVGWKGLINDPNLDGTFQINKGLRTARKFLLQVNELGLPAGCEFLDTISPQFIADLVAWGAIGARTSESQVHRELASGLSCPVGFKNGTSGDVQIAVDACKAGKSRHSFLSVTKQGIAAIVHTRGNPSCHVILRGGTSGTNYDKESIENAAELGRIANVKAGIMVDCSHGNSKKIHTNQPKVASELCKLVSEGNKSICGVMIESHLNEGSQKLDPGKTKLETLKKGVSVTDACISFAQTEKVLHELAKAVQTRRKLNK